jgi:hypothetical protein
MEPAMRASWREWLVLRLGGKNSRERTILNLGDEDNLPQRRIRLLALIRRKERAVREKGVESGLYSRILEVGKQTETREGRAHFQ